MPSITPLRNLRISVPGGHMPPYPTLDTAEAEKRGADQTVTQPVIQDPNGGYHEPVTLIYSGPLNNLQKALHSQGWRRPHLLPISPMTVDGQPDVLTLQKNAFLGGLSRDHLRVYDLGTNPQTGASQYGIAATRDNHPYANHNGFHHTTDPVLSGERDLIMHDVLIADPAVASKWTAEQGQLTHELSSSYQSDGQVYRFSLP
ncbi:MAG TPA: LssY C-terminal domain-containing protein [Candidatus Xenobia bacterium]|jgi:hypothetical protein